MTGHISMICEGFKQHSNSTTTVSDTSCCSLPSISTKNVPQLPQSKTNDKKKHKLTACIKKEINHLNLEIIKPII